MKLIFERSVPGRRCSILPACDVEETPLPESLRRAEAPVLPELSEQDLSRHYTELNHHVHGVNCGFYPLGSCTMKYNPRINEEMAALPGFTGIHPLAPAHTVQGCRRVLELAQQYLCEITGMDGMTFQPAAGAHGEFTGVLLIKQYHDARGDKKRTKIIVPDSAHGTNPATAAMCGYQVVNIPSAPNGCVDLEALKAVLGDDTAGLMLTNPNTVGIFDENILEITRLVHEAGGLCYYDGANLNAVMGVVRPGDMGFDCIHLNLHKTFSTPHGGGGPGAGAVGCKDFLKPYLPHSATLDGEGHIQVRAFAGNFLVVVRALAYLLKSYGLLDDDVEEVLDCYFRSCSIRVDCRALAHIGAVLSNRGRLPNSSRQIFPAELARYVNAILTTCGMYDGSGEFAIRVGVPAKSGVGGGIMAVVPTRMGIGIYGPALDRKGNSVAGIQLLERLSRALYLSIF